MTGSKQNCKVYLIVELVMRYDLNLLQFLLSPMEMMHLVQESMEMPGLGGWNWLKKS